MRNKVGNKMIDREIRNKKLSTPIFSLNTDCTDEIFEFLSLEDLHSLGQTCSTMQKVAGDYFQRNWKTIHASVSKDSVLMGVSCCNAQIPGFRSFVNSVKAELRSAKYKYPIKYLGEFRSIREIDVFIEEIGDSSESLREILPKIEVLKLRAYNDTFDGDIYETCLKYCKNLREFYVYNDQCQILKLNGENQWMNQVYPSLQMVHLKPKNAFKINELCAFLERNRSIQTFSTSLDLLWKNRDDLLQSKIKLDILQIHYYDNSEFADNKKACELLCDLFKQGIYKRLHVYTCWSTSKLFEPLDELNILELMMIEHYINWEIFWLKNVKYLLMPMIFYDGARVLALEITNLKRLEHFVIGRADSNYLRLIIRELPNLRKIEIDIFTGTDKLNLIELNNERKHLIGAKRVIIFVPDQIFLSTKWTTPYGHTNLSHIVLKRQYAQ